MRRTAAVAIAEDVAQPGSSPYLVGDSPTVRPGSREDASNEAETADASAARSGAAGGKLGSFRHIVTVALTVLGAVALSLALQMTLVSGLEHRAAQQSALDKLRKQLAQGTAPLGQKGQDARLLALGAPVAVLDIPSIHVHEVVLEGTTPGVLMSGPGHRRDTPLPGQAGTSYIFGRAAAYGGPFGGLHSLRVGAKIVVTTQEATSTFKVIDRRHKGDPTPPPLTSGNGRLTLVTARGTPFVPSGALYVDANLSTPTQSAPARAFFTSQLLPSERAMATDSSTLWALVLWLQALVVIAVGIVWSWTRWGRHQTWIVFLPLTALVGFFASDQFIRLLPNLM
jgi:LPXTG-site transpeptidase (sortase) family protein